MKNRDGKGPPSADLLVCFPSRAHLTLMPKPICSPARPTEAGKRHQHNHHHHHHYLIKKSNNRGGGAGQASPMLWSKSRHMSSEISEPTSPKVTCAGQIKIRPKPSSCKNWQSVMEEIERLHNNRKHKRRPTWMEALGFKKEIMQFLTCLRSIKFDFRCFGSFPAAEVTSDDDEDDEEDEEYFQEHQKDREEIDSNETSATVFSKWFMVLQENQNKEFSKKEEKEMSCKAEYSASDDPPCAPPSNALLLMRCRSAPAKSWLEEKEEEEDNHEEEEEEREESGAGEEENDNREESLLVMRYGSDFYKFSSDIAKETWIVGGRRDPLSRSRSWKR